MIAVTRKRGNKMLTKAKPKGKKKPVVVGVYWLDETTHTRFSSEMAAAHRKMIYPNTKIVKVVEVLAQPALRMTKQDWQRYIDSLDFSD